MGYKPQRGCFIRSLMGMGAGADTLSMGVVSAAVQQAQNLGRVHNPSIYSI
jgi:hypothetical protein